MFVIQISTSITVNINENCQWLIKYNGWLNTLNFITRNMSSLCDQNNNGENIYAMNVENDITWAKLIN